MPEAERRARVTALFGRIGMAGLEDRQPAKLSGGQQQRVAVARALASRPAIIFADEPTGNLDSRASTEILEFMRKAVDDLKQTIVMVTHDPELARLAHRSVHVLDGQVMDLQAIPETGEHASHETPARA